MPARCGRLLCSAVSSAVPGVLPPFQSAENEYHTVMTQAFPAGRFAVIRLPETVRRNCEAIGPQRG